MTLLAQVVADNEIIHSARVMGGLMQGERWYIRDNVNKAALASFVATLDATPEKPYVAQIIPWVKKRSLDQSALFHMWCGEISKQGGEYTPIQIKARAKYSWGVPILVAEMPSFARSWEAMKSIMSHEELLEALEWFPVTSLMNTNQMSRFLTDMQRVSCQKYRLTDPALYGLEVR